MMKNDSNNRKSHILLAYAGKTTTADIMVRLMNEYAKARDINVVSKEVLTICADDINNADTVVIIRGADYFLSKIMRKAKRAGKQCIFYIDDDLLALYEVGSEYHMYLISCLKYADILWASNRNVLKKYSEYVHECTRCVETVVLDPWNQVQPYESETNKVKIVYAGSPSHEKTILKYIYPALQRVYEKHNDIEVLLVGYKGTAIDGLLPYIRTTGWFDNAEEYRSFLNNEKAQIGIGIIEDSNFGRCKFYNKFLEYTKLGIMGLYSNCEPYSFVVKDKENGLLVNNSVDDWTESMIKAVENPMLRKECVKNAQELLLRKFSTNAVIEQIRDAIPEIERFQGREGKVHYNAKFLMYMYLFKRYIKYLVHPVNAIRKCRGRRQLLG